jgi:membrane protein DedA with SNARE-associated domain
MLDSLISQYGYLAILVGTFLEGETILIVGGLAAHKGLLELPGVMLAAFVGSTLSDQLFFFLGRRHGEAWLARRPQWQAGVQRVRGLLNRHSTLLILTFRFLYGLRNITPFALGLSDVPATRFLVLNVLGAAVWSVAIALLGWSVGEAAKQMLGHVEHYERGIGAAIIVVGVLLWIWHHVGRRRRAGDGTPPPHSG